MTALFVVALIPGVALATVGGELAKKIEAETLPPGSSTRALYCGDALEPDCGDGVDGSNVGLNSTADSYSCVGWSETGGEVVYELVLTGATIVSATLSDMSADLDVFLLGSCDEGDCLEYGDNSLTSDCLDPGTYYIVVDGYYGAESDFTLSVTCVGCEAQENEDCASAFDLCALADANGNFDIPYSTLNTANDYNLGYGNACTGWSSNGGDLVYEVCLNPGGEIVVTQTGDYDMSLYLITDCDDPEGSCVAGSDNCCTGADEVVLYLSPGGGIYYLIVDGYSNEGSGNIAGTIIGCCETSTQHDTWGNVKRLFRQ